VKCRRGELLCEPPRHNPAPRRFYELNVSVSLQKSEIADEIESLRPHFEIREADHLGQVPLAIAPVQSRYRDAPESSRGITFALILRQVVQRDRSQPFAAHHNALGLTIFRGHGRLNDAGA